MNGLYGIPDSQQLPDLDEIDYMAGTAIPLQAKAEGGVEQDLLIDEDLLRQVMKAIYDGTADDIDPDLFREVLRILRQAQEEGERKAEEPMPPEFRQRVDYNTAAFSAFKVHRLQGDMARQLTDENGVLKPFEQWLNDVQPIASHHCGAWLRTEYDTAVLRMQQAADWQRFERDSDIMPCLEWMPSTSLHPGADHKIYWHTVLPVDDPFWSRHRPGDRWNCKCWLQNTDKQPTAVPGDDDSPANRPAPGLDNNPGRDGKLFADSHPYIAEAYPGAKEAVEKTLKKSGITETIKEQRKLIQKEAAFLKEKTFRNPGFDHDVGITGKSIKEWLNQPHTNYTEKNEALLSLEEIFSESVYRGSGPDKHDPNGKFYLFEIEIKKEKSWIIVRNTTAAKGFWIYSITDSQNMLNAIEEKPEN